MVMGVVLAGILAGFSTAMISVLVGHAMEMTLLLYTTAGVIGALCFGMVAVRQQPAVLR